MTTMKDVAKEAGVSIATVSRFINGERVSKKTQKRITKAIEILGYQPNQVARSLKTNRTMTVGFVVADFGPFFMEVAKSIEEVLNKYGYNLIVCNSDEDLEREQKRVKMLCQKQVDGLIIVPTSSEANYLSKVQQMGIPIILVDRLVKNLKADCVLVDNVNGAYKAVEHLVTQGYKRIGLINGRQEVTTGEERYKGYLRVLEDYHLKVDEKLIKTGNFTNESGYELMKELMKLPEPPEAVFVANYYMTIGAMMAIKEMDLKVPEDIALVGFDDMELTQLTTPPLTAVVQPMHKIGKAVAELLYKRISNNNENFPELYRLKPKLLVRGSSISDRETQKQDR